MYFTQDELVAASKKKLSTPLLKYNSNGTTSVDRTEGVYFYSCIPVADSIGSMYPGQVKGSTVLTNLTKQQAKAEIKAMRETLFEHRLPKSNRPWDIADITSGLDEAQVWLGVEFETGFNGVTNFRRAMNYIWTHLKYVAVDREGVGEFITEITFPPQNLSDYEQRKSKIHRLYGWLDRHGGAGMASLINRGSSAGTHINISSPAWRAKRSNEVGSWLSHINYALQNCNDTQMRQLFGRRPYGYGYTRGNAADDKHWVEFKLFASTANSTQFDGYIAVAKKIAEAMEWCATTNPSPELLVSVFGSRQYDYSSDTHVTTTGIFAEYLTGNIESPFINTVNVELAEAA